MRIILDENVPFALRRMLAPRQVTTVQQSGFRGLQNGALLAALEGLFDVLVTADKIYVTNRILQDALLLSSSCPRTAGPDSARYKQRSSRQSMVVSRLRMPPSTPSVTAGGCL